MYYLTLIFLIFISSFNYIISSSNRYKCKKEDINREIEIGDEVTLCLHSKELGKKIAYKLKVDKYSIITIKGGYPTLIPVTPDVDKTDEPPSTDGNNRFRNMKKEPFDEGKLNNPVQTSDIYTDKSDIISDMTDKIDKTYVSDIKSDSTVEQSDEESLDNPSDKAKILAQIGDKMTKYPSVSYMLIIFYIIAILQR